MTIRAVIFDLGHTVWDYAPTEHGRRLSIVRLHGALADRLDGEAPSIATLDDAVRAASRRWFERWSDQRDLSQPPSASFISDALGTLGIEPEAGLLEELAEVLFGVELDMPVVEPDSLAAIAALHERGISMGCVTNTVLLRSGIEEILQRLGLFRYFLAVAVSSEGGYRKPHPSLFHHVLDALAVDANEAVFVGDRLWDDIAGAQRAGMRAVLTHQYRQEPPGGIGVTPDAVIGRLGELPEVIERMASPAADIASMKQPP